MFLILHETLVPLFKVSSFQARIFVDEQGDGSWTYLCTSEGLEFMLSTGSWRWSTPREETYLCQLQTEWCAPVIYRLEVRGTFLTSLHSVYVMWFPFALSFPTDSFLGFWHVEHCRNVTWQLSKCVVVDGCGSGCSGRNLRLHCHLVGWSFRECSRQLCMRASENSFVCRFRTGSSIYDAENSLPRHSSYCPPTSN